MSTISFAIASSVVMDRQLYTGPFEAASETAPPDGRVPPLESGVRAAVGLVLPVALTVEGGSWNPSRAECSRDTAASSRSNASSSRSRLRTCCFVSLACATDFMFGRLASSPRSKSTSSPLES
eukprot:CAMPEP_0118951304 /NCGR_PEP_ID=MMETSP1169-20130426/52879_1 /TAXON_ID=36882 /ORGANISM="Pyramimonas obovata, Strain CCMP722" /LENGTH=122 /DNA_ID=CAMNT_0006898337 /DNA_START=340 /DNA_END=708 /DNA_ORIENTATION=-